MKRIFKSKAFMLFSALVICFCCFLGAKLRVNKDFVKADDVENPTVTIEANNLSYADSIYILYAVSNDGFDRLAYKIKMLVWEEAQEEYVLGTETYVVNSNQSTNVKGKNCLIFYSDGLAAKEMTKDIYARAYVEIDGETYYSDLSKFSVLEYVYTMRESGNLTDKQQKLFDNMLNYGAAAQEIFGWEIDRLANDTYYKINVINGILPDGFACGRYKKGDVITLKANAVPSGEEFLCWKDKDGNIVGESEEIEIAVGEENNEYMAIYQTIGGEETLQPEIPSSAVFVNDKIWRADGYALKTETAEKAPEGFHNVTEFDWLNNMPGWATTSTALQTSIFDRTTNLSGYSDIYFAIKIVNGTLKTLGLAEEDWYSGGDWVYVHYQQGEDGLWSLVSLISLDGYAKTNVQAGINASALDGFSTLRGLFQNNGASGLCPIRESAASETVIYMTNVLGVAK